MIFPPTALVAFIFCLSNVIWVAPLGTHAAPGPGPDPNGSGAGAGRERGRVKNVEPKSLPRATQDVGKPPLFFIHSATLLEASEEP